MREETRLLNAIDDAQAAGAGFALATVVRVRGSAYRREGAKMLIDEFGSQVCTISGGCLEQEVGEIAARILTSGEPEIHAFDLDEDVVWGLGIGCGGAVDVLIEPHDERPAHLAWLRALREERPAALATVLSAPDGGAERYARLLVEPDGATTGGLGDAALDARVRELAVRALATPYPRAKPHRLPGETGEVEVFFEYSLPPLRLVLFGAGHDAIPLAALGRSLGFRVTLVDARPVFLTAERFPGAELVRSHPEGFADAVAIDPRCYAVIMNHHLERDRESLAFLLGTPAAYIGALGPHARLERLVDGLNDEGRAPDPAELARVRSPVGVDVGAEAPEEVAVSIMAEVLAVRGGYDGGFLKDRAGRIHARS